MNTVFVTFGGNKKGVVNYLGPVFSNLEEAKKWVDNERFRGCFAAWVEVGFDDWDFGGYLL